METKLELLGLGNLIGNIYKVISGEISKEKDRSKHFFRIEQLNAINKINFTTSQTMKIKRASLPS